MNGAVPPVTVACWLNATFTTVVFVVVVGAVIVGPAMMFQVKLAVVTVTRFASLTVTFTLAYDFTVVGFPVICPVDVEMVRPAGKPVHDQV